MKHLNQSATAIARKLLQLMEESADKVSLKIDNAPGAFMPVHLEMRSEIPGYGPAFSIGHYYSQNGDLMSDPYMEFVILKDKEIYPILFEQHGSLATYQEAFLYHEDGSIRGVIPGFQRDMTSFANGWLVNIQRQQEISVKKSNDIKLLLVDEAKEIATVEINGQTQTFEIQEDQDGKHYLIIDKKAVFFKDLP